MDGDTNHISKTIIDGSKSTNPDTASVVAMRSGEDTTSVLMGFTLTGGSGTITKEWYFGYTCIAGGGIFIFNSGGKIINNIIEGNHLDESELLALGDGIMARVNGNRTAIIRNNIIRNNSSIAYGHWGGGISLFGGRVLVENNMISNNILNGLGLYTCGAGIWYQNEAELEGVINEVIIRNNLIVGNKAYSEGDMGFGSGICEYGLLKYQQMQIYNNIIAKNFTEGYGGGFYICFGYAQVYNNTFFNNEATIDGNSLCIDGGGIPLFYNNIIWSNAKNKLSEYFFSEDVYVTAYYNILKEPFKSGDPVTAAYNLYHIEPIFQNDSLELTENSPGIGWGIDSLDYEGTWYYAPATDFKGNPRPHSNDSYVDLGAYESTYPQSNYGINSYKQAGLSIYPNPVSDIGTFEFENNNNRKVYLEIFDFSGRLIGEKTSTNEKIEFDFSNYSSGIYFYKLRNSEGIIGAGKIVRE